MSNEKDKEYAKEFLSPDVARKQIIAIGDIDRIPPTVGIFDNPVRCFRVNHEWWRVISGMVHWLADVAAWKDATDDEYYAIKEILRFMQGVECGEMLLQQNPENVCQLLQSFDGGETWSLAFDYSLCLAPLNDMVQSIFHNQQEQEIEPEFDPQETTIEDVYPSSDLANMELVSDEACDSAGKNKIFGAARQIVTYIDANNIDLLQQIGQDIGNIGQQAQTIISAMPIIGLLPADEAAGYIAFIANELYGEYLATVDEDLLNSVRCDLFCIAVANDCRLDFNDVLGYFSDHVTTAINQFGTTLSELANFALTGSFTGDEYFYLMCFIQLQSVGLGGTFGTISSLDSYVLQAQLGANNPSSDWTILCDDCPTFTHWEWNWDFAWGSSGWFVQFGTIESDGIIGVDFGDSYKYQIFYTFEGQYNIKRIAGLVSANNHIGNGSDDFETYSAHPNAADPYGSGTIAYHLNFVDVNGSAIEFCFDSDAVNNTSRSIQMFGSMSKTIAEPELKLLRVRVIGADNGNGKPSTARWRTSAPLCVDFVG